MQWGDNGVLAGSEPLGGMSCSLAMGLAFWFIPAHLLEQLALAARPAGLGCALQFILDPQESNLRA